MYFYLAGVMMKWLLIWWRKKDAFLNHHALFTLWLLCSREEEEWGGWLLLILASSSGKMAERGGSIERIPRACIYKMQWRDVGNLPATVYIKRFCFHLTSWLCRAAGKTAGRGPGPAWFGWWWWFAPKLCFINLLYRYWESLSWSRRVAYVPRFDNRSPNISDHF